MRACVYACIVRMHSCPNGHLRTPACVLVLPAFILVKSYGGMFTCVCLDRSVGLSARSYLRLPGEMYLWVGGVSTVVTRRVCKSINSIQFIFFFWLDAASSQRSHAYPRRRHTMQNNSQTSENLFPTSLTAGRHFFSLPFSLPPSLPPASPPDSFLLEKLQRFILSNAHVAAHILFSLPLISPPPLSALPFPLSSFPLLAHPSPMRSRLCPQPHLPDSLSCCLSLSLAVSCSLSRTPSPHSHLPPPRSFSLPQDYAPFLGASAASYVIGVGLFQNVFYDLASAALVAPTVWLAVAHGQVWQVLQFGCAFAVGVAVTHLPAVRDVARHLLLALAGAVSALAYVWLPAFVAHIFPVHELEQGRHSLENACYSICHRQ